MSYLNPLLQYGLEKFARQARQSGVCGLVVPDIIPEESRRLEQVCRCEGIDVVHLLAPTSTPVRRRLILRRSRGFVYLVTVTGVTGVRRRLAPSLNGWIQSIKRESPVPVAVGFGISNPVQARQVARVADGVIVGSAIINLLREGGTSSGGLTKVRRFVRQLRRAMKR